MLDTSVIEGTNVVSVTVDGSISANEEVEAQQTIDKVAAQHGTANMLVDYTGIDVGRVEPKAAWEDLKASRLLGSIDRVGVVTDSGVVDKFAQAAGAVSPVEVRTFATEERDEAVAWLTS